MGAWESVEGTRALEVVGAPECGCLGAKRDSAVQWLQRHGAAAIWLYEAWRVVSGVPEEWPQMLSGNGKWLDPDEVDGDEGGWDRANWEDYDHALIAAVSAIAQGNRPRST